MNGEGDLCDPLELGTERREKPQQVSATEMRMRLGDCARKRGRNLYLGYLFSGQNGLWVPRECLPELGAGIICLHLLKWQCFRKLVVKIFGWRKLLLLQI